MTAPKPGAVLRHAAITLEVAAALAVVAVGAYALYLKVVLEPTTVDVYRSHVGSRLLPFVAAGAGVLVVGAVAGRPGLLGAYAPFLAGAAAVITIIVTFAGFVIAQHQLHPSFTLERAELASFAPPPGAQDQTITTQAGATPTINAHWYVPGQATQVCAAAEASLRSWADPGTVQRAAEPSPDCSLVARKGADQVSLYGFFVPGSNEVSLSLVLTQPI